MLTSTSLLLLGLGLGSSVIAETNTSSFPIVDLGYARHAATFVNTSFQDVSYATYRNIRFAQPPTGELRFRAPVTPPLGAEGIQDGLVEHNSTNCVQTWTRGLTTPPGYNGTTWGSEDCLFLDVIVPEGLSSASAGTGVPVLHWLYGGGFFTGAKEWSGNPAALFEQLSKDGKFIIVASNYRLGPLGWMSSDEEPTISPNAALYDGWEALQWTKQYVHLFGGDPEKVTVMGQSAGAGMIQHYLAADAGGKYVPFNQAILSSAGYRPHVNRSREMTEIYQLYLNSTGCEDVSCLRQLPEEDIIEAQKYIFLDADTGVFGGPSIGFGPVIDGNLVLDVPERLLANGHAADNAHGRVKRVIAGGMANEGIGNAHATWEEIAALFARTPTESTVAKLEELYGQYHNESAFAPDGSATPTVYDWFYGDIIFNCHSYFSSQYWSNVSSDASCDGTISGVSRSTEAYRYIVSVPPAFHGQDLNFYFFDKNVAAVDPTTDPDTARQFQSYLRRFVLGQHLEDWPEYSLDTPSRLNITTEGINFESPVESEDHLAERCEAIVEMLSNEEDGW